MFYSAGKKCEMFSKYLEEITDQLRENIKK
jgi:hypothetical protein